ncbi:hypothetical protein KAU19_00880 [Candidatus Parcubacteria bacterium]|nr:hypothetical protein [Candidatus Parcubacteria bacterium]
MKKPLRFEEKIQTRGKIKKFFFGGDKENAEALQQETSQNQGKIAELKSLYKGCDCQQEVKEVLAEQIQNLDIEQNRLRQLAKKQLDSKGVFGWMFGWLSK